jgi:hypothetical protein
VSVIGSKTTKALVDVEIYDPNGTRVHQAVLDNQAFTARTGRYFYVVWPVPRGAPVGTYTVMVGTFSPGWGTLYHWDDNAGTFTVR